MKNLIARAFGHVSSSEKGISALTGSNSKCVEIGRNSGKSVLFYNTREITERKRQILMVSKSFMKDHPKCGQETNFRKKLESGEKIHTIRGNYQLWKQKEEKINSGEFFLDVRQWSGTPYQSKQIPFGYCLEIGVQQLLIVDGIFFVDSRPVPIDLLAKNDGLSREDFLSWFTPFPEEPLAIIQLTKFRY